jgi:hypothetical protein
VLIGGLLSSTLFVLTITPAVYYLLERRGAREPVASPSGDRGVLQMGGATG